MQIAFYPTFLLDSNLASPIGSYFNNASNGKIMAIPKHIENFMHYLLMHKFDPNPMFYYLEAYCKNSLNTFAECVLPIAKGLLIFQTLDEGHFLRYNEIKLDPSRMEEYFKEYGTYSLDKITQAKLDVVCTENGRSFISRAVTLTYLCLIKMVLLHKFSKKTFVDKLEEFSLFMIETLDCLASRELFIAMLYFLNQTGRFINVEINSNFENAKKYLMNSAWDILLLRMPEVILSHTRPTEQVPLTLICTAERKVQDIAKRFTIEFILLGKGFLSQNKGLSSAFINMDIEDIHKIIEKHHSIVAFEKFNTDFMRKRTEARFIEKHGAALDYEKIRIDLELELRKFLS